MGSRRPGFVRAGFRRAGQASGGGGGTITQILGTPPISVAGGTGPIATVSHDDSAIAPGGTYAYPSAVVVDQKGHVTSVTAGAAPVGSVAVTTPITNTGTATAPNIGHANSSISPGGTYAFPASVVVDGKGHIQGVTAGSALAFTSPMENAGTSTAPNVRIKNSGQVAGRGSVPILLDYASISGTTYASPTWAANTYWKLCLELRLTPGLQVGSPCGIRFNGVTTSSYLGGVTYCIGGGNPQGFGSGGFNAARGTYGILALTGASPASDLSMIIDILPLVNGSVNPAWFGRFTSKGTADTNYLFGSANGEWEATGAVTEVDLLFFGPTVGTVTLWGVPF